MGAIGVRGDGVSVDVAGMGDVAGARDFWAVDGVAGADNDASDGSTPVVRRWSSYPSSMVKGSRSRSMEVSA